MTSILTTNRTHMAEVFFLVSECEGMRHITKLKQNVTSRNIKLNQHLFAELFNFFATHTV